MRHILRSDGWRPYLLVAPAVTVIMVVFGGGIGLGFVQSLGYLPVLGLTQPTLAHYAALLADQRIYAGMALTFAIALSSTVIATLLALVAAMTLRRVFRGSRPLTFVYQVPLPVPHLVAAAGLVMLLTQSGVFARVLYSAGLLTQPAEFPPIFFDRNSLGIVLVYVWKEAPFIGLVLLAILKGSALEYEEVASTLGASSWQRFRFILLPLMLPGILSTSVIVFAFMFGSFEIPLLLGVRYPEVLPVMAYRLYIDPDLTQRPAAMAIGMVITFIVIVALGLYRWLARRAVAP